MINNDLRKESLTSPSLSLDTFSDSANNQAETFISVKRICSFSFSVSRAGFLLTSNANKYRIMKIKMVLPCLSLLLLSSVLLTSVPDGKPATHSLHRLRTLWFLRLCSMLLNRVHLMHHWLLSDPRSKLTSHQTSNCVPDC